MTRSRPMALARSRMPVRLVALMLLVLAVAAILPRLAHARPRVVTPIELADGVARVALPDVPGPLTVEWGTAPLASKIVRPPPGARSVELRGLVPGGVYVYRVMAGRVPVTRPTPFVMPGGPPLLPGHSGPLSL